MGGGRRYPIIDIDKVKNQYADIIISIADENTASEIKTQLHEHGLNVVELRTALMKHNVSTIEYNREQIAEYHVTDMDEYFRRAESDDSLRTFWGSDSAFYRMFKKMDVSRVIELACGRGRHVPYYMDFADEIVLVDILEKNIELCKKRFDDKKISFLTNNGYDLSLLDDNSYTALFTYDAMVHFELMDIFKYLNETYRVLEKGGMALFHHSNNAKDYRTTFETAPHGRNYMSKDLFAYLACRAGLNIVEQQVIDWGERNLDCITLVSK